MRLQFTLHAQKRMQQRRVSEDDVRWVLFEPDDIENYNGEAVAIRSGAERMIKVVYELLPGDIYRVITVIAQRVRSGRRSI